MSTELRESACEGCGKTFRYECHGRIRWRCPDCRVQVRVNYRALQGRQMRIRDGESSAQSHDALGYHEIRDEVECAKILGVTRQRVQQVTRTALARLRASAALRNLLDEMAGREPRLPERRASAPRERSLGEWVESWRALAEHLARSGQMEEAREVQAEIVVFQKVWAEALDRKV